jgi:hypothetical protein
MDDACKLLSAPRYWDAPDDAITTLDVVGHRLARAVGLDPRGRQAVDLGGYR